MKPDMIFDGQTISWKNNGKFKATSGMVNYQYPIGQCIQNKGPIPEGLYKVFINDNGLAKDDGTGRCALEAS